MTVVGVERPSQRMRSMDALRAFLVAWIIAGHALLGYAAVGGWAYDEVAEVTFAPAVEWVLAALIGPTALFLMGTFFLIAGLFTPASLAHKGPREFLRRRLLRLGLPFLVMMLAVWPATLWLAYWAAGRSVSYAWLLTGRERLVLPAVGIMIVGFSDNVLTARALASRRGEHIDANRELAALGLTNVASGVLRGFPVSCGGSRTVLGDAVGSRTQLYSLAALGAVLLTLLVAGPVLEGFPTAALGALVIYAAYGVLAAVGLSIMDLLRKLARPHDGILGYVPGVAGMHDIDDYPDAARFRGWWSTATTRRCASPTPRTSAAAPSARWTPPAPTRSSSYEPTSNAATSCSAWPGSSRTSATSSPPRASSMPSATSGSS